MPTYDRYCFSCDEIFEIRRSMSDDSPVVCPKCNGTQTRQVFIETPTIFSRKIDHPDSPLDEIPGHEKMRDQADVAVRRAMKDMGMDP